MPKNIITLSIDVEASGPIPGPHWMCSFGVCRTDAVEQGFSVALQPLVIPGVSADDVPGAMEVVAAGLPAVNWDPAGDPIENTRVVRLWFEEHGVPPREALDRFEAWMRTTCGDDRPVLVGSPVTFDFLWIYWYWWYLRQEMPPFGFSGLDLRSYFMGAHGVGFLGTGKQRYLKHYPNEHAHTHDPLDDARQQGRIWQDLVTARERAPRGIHPRPASPAAPIDDGF